MPSPTHQPTTNGTAKGPDEDARRWCIQVAAEFIAAQPGGIARILTAHRQRPDGTCAGCLHAPTPWPCTTVTITHRAQHLPEPRDQRPPIHVIDEQVEQEESP